MPDYPLLSTRVIGEAESALGALLAPLLAEAELTFLQWVALSLTTANAATGIGRDQLVDLIASARKVEKADASAAVSELERAAALVVAGGQVSLTDAGQTRYGQVRARIQEITERIFDLPGEDLAVAGRVLAVITTRANDVLADTA
jgi:DNA-binding MarR family transcriptional regulator